MRQIFYAKLNFIKRPDATDANYYRRISNLVYRYCPSSWSALNIIMSSADIQPARQSEFQPGHSTEAYVLRVLPDILLAFDRGELAALILLDSSTAFDTIDHDILLQRLQKSFGINDVALQWFQSYLLVRSQYVRRGDAQSSVTAVMCGVSQGFVLGPILFIMYTAGLISVIESHGLSPNMYADNTQVSGFYRPAAVDGFPSKVSVCIGDVFCCMKSNRLSLNCDKTELLWCATCRRQHQLPNKALSIDGILVEPVKSAYDFGIYIDSDLLVRAHVKRTVLRCFAVMDWDTFALQWIGTSCAVRTKTGVQLERCSVPYCGGENRFNYWYGGCIVLSTAADSTDTFKTLVASLYSVYTIQQTSSKRPENVFKMHVLTARRLLDRVNGVLVDRRSGVQSLAWTRAAIRRSA